MTKLTQPEVVDLLRAVGFKPRAAKVGSAIALCEAPTFTDPPMSDFGAIGDQDLADDVWGFSYGGFQVRSLRAQQGTGGWRDEDRLLEPRFNCRAAKAIRKDLGWDAWSAYTNGAYRAYLQDLYPPPPNTYIVLAGDTLSSIAAAYGTFMWEDLARTNGLHSPYTIFIGQLLTLPTLGENHAPH